MEQPKNITDEKISIKTLLGTSTVLLFIGGIGSVVTIYGNIEWLPGFAGMLTLSFIVLSVCFYLYALIKWLNRVGNQISSINMKVETLERNNSGSGWEERVQQLEDQYKKIVETTSGFNSVCSGTRTAVAECQAEILQKLNEKSRFKYNTAEVTADLMKMLEMNHRISEIKIICFGRSGYGEIVQQIYERNLPIKVKIIVCNPEKNEFICRRDDAGNIKNLIKSMLGHHAEVYVSDIPPAIRASAVYIRDDEDGTEAASPAVVSNQQVSSRSHVRVKEEEDDGNRASSHAVWCAIQSYQFTLGADRKIELSRPRKSLITTCDESSSKSDFEGIVKCFESEFNRLYNSSMIPDINANGDVVFVEKKGER